jgi:Tfp pilus assembly protein PilE
MRRRGLTFVEIMVVVVIGTLLIMIVVQWQARFSTMFGSAVADMALQSDARILFDYFSQDLSSAVLVASGKDDAMSDFDFKGTAGQALSIVRLKKDPLGRHIAGTDKKKPQYLGSPHYTDNGEPVVQTWPAVRVIYEVEDEPQKGEKKTYRVFRTEIDGTYTRTEDKPKCDRENGWTYKFSGKAGRKQQMATRVTKWAVVPLGFLPEKPVPVVAAAPGAPPPVPDPNAPAPIAGFIPPSRFFTVWSLGKPCAQLYHIAALGVHYTSEDVKIGAKGQEGKVELVSKFWIEERSAAYRFNQAFSSIDENL